MPGEDRGRPTQIECDLRIPAGETVEISVDFERAFLGIEEFPPDPNRGFDMPPVVATLLLGDEDREDGEDGEDGVEGEGEAENEEAMRSVAIGQTRQQM